METKSLGIRVPKPLWMAISVAAMEDDKSLAEVVIPVLDKAFSGLVQVGGVAQRAERSSTQSGRNPEVGGAVTGSKECEK